MRATETTRLTMRPRGDGTTDVNIRIGDTVAARLRTYLEAYASPRRAHLRETQDEIDPATGERIPYAALMGRAFCSLLEAVPTDRLPRHGGRSTAVVVSIDHATLVAQVGAAGLTTGERISAAEAMRLACEAGIAPMVFGGDGQPLHLGRLQRLFSEAQRLAMDVRDQHCRAEGCDVPAAWCEAHHLIPWALGGETDIKDGVLLCSWHHHRAHEPDRRVERLPNGDIRFHRRI